jgi:hypothetical protein
MPGEENPNSVTENQASFAADMSRRDFVTTVSVATGGFALTQRSAHAAIVRTDIAICRRMAMARCRRASGHAQLRTSMA